MRGVVGYPAASIPAKSALGFPGVETGACARPHSSRFARHRARSACATFLLGTAATG